MNLFELSRKSLIVMLLSLMALVMLPACSTTEESASGDTSGDSVDCSQFTNDIDVKECEAAQQIHN